jgi:hypothetical protein
MRREILDVRRCTVCQTVVQALVQDDYLDDEGHATRAIYWLPRRAHGKDECDRMLTLAREEWPTLFEIES